MIKTAGRYITTIERKSITRKLNNAQMYQLADVVNLLFKTGIRIGELDIYLEAVKNAKRDAEFVTIQPLKHNNKRQIPIVPEAKLLVVDGKLAIKSSAARKGIQRANQELKLNFSPHDARHTLFTNAARETPNEFVLMAMTGHTKASSVSKYVHTAQLENSQLYNYGFDPTHYDRNEDYFKKYKTERSERERLEVKLTARKVK